MTNTTQLRILREASRVTDPKHQLELVMMADDLLDAGYEFGVVADAIQLHTQGNVSRRERLRQALDIMRAWPEDTLELAKRYGADWHALREPARWWRMRKVERNEVVAFVHQFVARKGRWPTTDELRRRFGYAAGHKGPGEAPGQEGLL